MLGSETTLSQIEQLIQAQPMAKNIEGVGKEEHIPLYYTLFHQYVSKAILQQNSKKFKDGSQYLNQIIINTHAVQLSKKDKIDWDIGCDNPRVRK